MNFKAEGSNFIVRIKQCIPKTLLDAYNQSGFFNKKLVILKHTYALPDFQA